MDEEVAPLGDGPSDDDVMANSSDEEDDSSSVSSKGEAERPEERRVKTGLMLLSFLFAEFGVFLTFDLSGQMQERQKSKIRHIATEIMTSEGV